MIIGLRFGWAADCPYGDHPSIQKPVEWAYTAYTSGRSGGDSLVNKLAEDIFNLFHYIQGDKSFDLFKLFPDKDKVRLRKTAITLSQTDINNEHSDQSDNTLDMTDDRSEDVELPRTLFEFCKTFLSEMRKDRDILTTDIKDIKRDTTLIRELRGEIDAMKISISYLTSKVEATDKQLQTRQKQIDKTSEECARLREELRNSKLLHDERHSSLRENITSTLNRINAIELLVGKSKSFAATAAVNISPTTSHIAAIPSTNSQAMSHQHPHNDVTKRPQQLNIHVPPTTDTRTSVKQRHERDVSSSEYIDIPARRKPSTEHQKPNKIVLQGFIPRNQRPKLDAIYMSGITTDGSKEEIVSSIEKFVEDKGMFVRAVRIVKQKGNTMAAKLVVKCDDVVKFVSDDFWPDGIKVHQWINDNT